MQSEEFAEALKRLDAIATDVQESKLESRVFQAQTIEKLESTNQRIDSLEKSLNQRIDFTNQRIDSLESSANQRFDSFEKLVNQRFESLEKTTDQRLEDLTKDFEIAPILEKTRSEPSAFQDRRGFHKSHLTHRCGHK